MILGSQGGSAKEEYSQNTRKRWSGPTMKVTAPLKALPLPQHRQLSYSISSNCLPHPSGPTVVKSFSDTHLGCCSIPFVFLHPACTFVSSLFIKHPRTLSFSVKKKAKGLKQRTFSCEFFFLFLMQKEDLMENVLLHLEQNCIT